MSLGYWYLKVMLLVTGHHHSFACGEQSEGGC